MNEMIEKNEQAVENVKPYSFRALVCNRYCTNVCDYRQNWNQ